MRMNSTTKTNRPGDSGGRGFIGLPGGVTVTTQSSGNIWSYPDLHGNDTVTTNSYGARQGTIDTYDPWGNLTIGDAPANNATGGSNLGAFGADGKITDTSTNITIMRARPYEASEGRYLGGRYRPRWLRKCVCVSAR